MQVKWDAIVAEVLERAERWGLPVVTERSWAACFAKWRMLG